MSSHYYTNLHVRSEDGTAIQRAVKEAGWLPAYVAQPSDGWTSVYPKEVAGKQMYRKLTSLCKALSNDLKAQVIGMLWREDVSLFKYVLCESNAIVDEYDSLPKQTDSSVQPTGGSVDLLVRFSTLGADDGARETMQQTLRNGAPSYVHQQSVAKFLGVPHQYHYSFMRAGTLSGRTLLREGEAKNGVPQLVTLEQYKNTEGKPRKIDLPLDGISGVLGELVFNRGGLCKGVRVGLKGDGLGLLDSVDGQVRTRDQDHHIVHMEDPYAFYPLVFALSAADAGLLEATTPEPTFEIELEVQIAISTGNKAGKGSLEVTISPLDGGSGFTRSYAMRVDDD